MRYRYTLATLVPMLGLIGAEVLPVDLGCADFDLECWKRQLEDDANGVANQCAFYFKEGIAEDYYNGVDWKSIYDIIDLSSGTDCAVWYDEDSNISWEGF